MLILATMSSIDTADILCRADIEPALTSPVIFAPVQDIVDASAAVMNIKLVGRMNSRVI